MAWQRDQILAIIKSTKEQGETTLSLARKGIEVLPPEIGQLITLQDLNLRGNRLVDLPPEIGSLKNLKTLSLQNNHLRTLPPELAQLENLELLELYSNALGGFPDECATLKNLRTLALAANRLTSLPEGIGQLARLQQLDLRDNSLSELPASLGLLCNLLSLYLERNQLKELPAQITQLEKLRILSVPDNCLSTLPHGMESMKALENLGLHNNQFTVLPTQIGSLPNLVSLDITRNKITTLPMELGNAPKLERLLFDEETVVSPPPEIMEQGWKAAKAYLLAQRKSSKKQWISKLILVGEGGVGKTSLLRTLFGESFNNQESSTRGIEIRSLALKHPFVPDVDMSLRTWDFGGQEIYHATHQFFLTNRSVFVLVWNARLGFEQGRLYYWLDLIHALAPDSPILIVASHIDQRPADLPIVALQKTYNQVRGHWMISNLNGQGIDDFRKALASTAAELPLMGETWPANWLLAADAIRALPNNYISTRVMQDLMAKHKLTAFDQNVLAKWMHELGDILYFPDDDELRGTVILKPDWVTRSISKVLESERLIRELGIFTRDDMDELWSDIESGMRDQLLRLMERFDLSYRTLENREISIVVERLRQDPPASYQQDWNDLRSTVGCKEISMKFHFKSSLPPGMPTWFIARSHRFTTHTHWRYGAVFADRVERKHLALVETRSHDRYIQLSVRGTQPQNFFALLREGLDLTIRRYPGIQVRRTIPCPCRDSQKEGPICTHEFDLEYLEKATEQIPPVLDVQCQKSFRMVSIMGLLFGIHWRMQDEVLEEIEAMRGDVHELLQLSQREFLKLFRRDQAIVDSHCPNIFTLRPLGSIQTLTGSFGRTLVDEWISQPIELQLYCQAPGQWHPTIEGGRYTIKHPAKWIRSLSPYLKRLLAILKYSAKAKAGISIDVKFKDYLVYMDKLTTGVLSSGETESYRIESVEGPNLRALHNLLDEVDHAHHWGDLAKILTPEGHYLWLCTQHAAEYNS